MIWHWWSKQDSKAVYLTAHVPNAIQERELNGVNLLESNVRYQEKERAQALEQDGQFHRIKAKHFEYTTAKTPKKYVEIHLKVQRGQCSPKESTVVQKYHRHSSR